jgi:hypothetical protein
MKNTKSNFSLYAGEIYDFRNTEYFHCIHTTIDGERNDLCNVCYNKGIDEEIGTCKMLPGVKLIYDDENVYTPGICVFSWTPEEVVAALKGTGKIYARISVGIGSRRGVYPPAVEWIIAKPKKVRESFNWWLNDFQEYTVRWVMCTDVLTGKPLYGKLKTEGDQE